MGQALAAGWADLGLTEIVAIDPSRPIVPGVNCAADLADLPADFAPAAVVLAIKPQLAEAALPGLARFQAGAVFLSIMAGRTLAGCATLLPGAALVRAMPNTPAAIGQGISVAVAGAGVSAAQKSLCGSLLAAVGAVEWTDDESLLDAVTAISGGGPAYVFLLTELLEQAGITQGLPPALARTLARATITGSGALLAASTEDAAVLRAAVTSPKGTTERALAVLLAEWPGAVERAIAAATARSRELGRPG